MKAVRRQQMSSHGLSLWIAADRGVANYAAIAVVRFVSSAAVGGVTL